ncbi:MAG: hypothetical protein E6J89_01440 [Deltaproteobacteria bacterium]|nr:MAG: hypothetical protein E6J89_01440 [Deltaproteobacteria bacterium]
MKKKCKKCGSDLYQAEDLKRFCLLCLAKEIEERDQEDDVSGTWRVLDPKTKPVTLRLSEVDLAKAKAKARKLRKPYQTLLKEVIHEALSRQ